VDQLTPRDQVCLLAYLTTRLAQVVSTKARQNFLYTSAE
jgi:hypothetical protein